MCTKNTQDQRKQTPECLGPIHINECNTINIEKEGGKEIILHI